MLSLLLAAAVAAAAPVPAHKFNVVLDAPVVCRLRFDDQLLIQSKGVQAESRIITLYAQRAKLTPVEITALNNFCTLFDMGANHAAKRAAEEAAENRPAPMDDGSNHIASFAE